VSHRDVAPADEADVGGHGKFSVFSSKQEKKNSRIRDFLQMMQ
jgi:hypothetical protein